MAASYSKYKKPFNDKGKEITGQVTYDTGPLDLEAYYKKVNPQGRPTETTKGLAAKMQLLDNLKAEAFYDKNNVRGNNYGLNLGYAF